MPNSLPRDLCLLLALAVIWSLSFTAIKVGVAVIPPTTLAMSRVVIGAIVLYALLKIKGHSLSKDPKVWATFFLIGLFGNAIPFVLINWGELKIASGLAAILIAAMPLATLVLGRLFSDEILNIQRSVGVLIGFAGVVVLIGPDEIMKLGDQAMRQFAVATAAVLYAIAAIFVRKLPGRKPLEHGSGVLIASALILIPASLVVDQPWTVDFTKEAVAVTVYLGVFPTALATLLLIVVVASRGVTFLALNNYMIPLLGVLWGVLFLNEAVTSQAITALMLILVGIAIAGLGPATQKDIPQEQE